MEGYIYVIYVREFLNSKENIIKVGQTSDIIRRFKEYPKGSKLLFTHIVDDRIQTEKEILELMKKKFTRCVTIGTEYFSGNIETMLSVVVQYVIQGRNIGVSDKVRKLSYTCIRCEYTSKRKSNIYTHLYNNKTMCKGSFNDIELTDEIKACIMSNGSYAIPIIVAVPKVPSLIQVIKDNQTITRYIINLESDVKIRTHFEYNNIKQISFKTIIQDKNERRVDQFKRGIGNPSLCMTEDCFLQSIESIVKNKDLKEISILFTKANQIKIFDGDWTTQRILPGIKIILIDLQEYLWNYYEIYLIRNAVNNNNKNQEVARYNEHLERYYHFLSCIGLNPFVDGRNKFNIMYDISDDKYDMTPSEIDVEFAEYYMEMYSKIKTNIKTSEVNKTFKDIIQIMKENYKFNIEKVNSAILSLIELDKEYKLKYIKQLY